jgi:hypothetical protein
VITTTYDKVADRFEEVFCDSLSPDQMVMMVGLAGFDILLAEMCDQPTGARDKGKWATIASRKGCDESSPPL